MKHLVLAMASSLFLSSCVSYSQYFQVCRTSFDPEMKRTGDAITFEDAHCIVTYNLWDKGGNIGFEFYNKTDQTIFLRMDESFLIVNGIAYDYFQGRTFEHSSNRGIAQGGLTTSSTPTAAGSSGTASGSANLRTFGHSVSYLEDRLIAIPSRTAKIISEYHVTDAALRNCDLPVYPDRRAPVTLLFTRKNSPLVFSNRLSYHTPAALPMQIENTFFVSEITNLGEAQAMEYASADDCTENRSYTRRIVKGAAPDKFFIPYRPETGLP